MRRPLLTAALAAALLAAACGGGGRPATLPVSTSTSAAEPATSTTTTAPARPLGVERREITIEDTSRTTAAAPDRGLAERPSRLLPLLVLMPDGPGPYPVVVFAHGVTASGPAYETFLTPVAAAGYIVVAPTFPLSSGPDGTIFDYPNQPADMSFTLDRILALAANERDPLAGRVDGEHVAFAGHSLGAMTTYGAVYNSCCADQRVDAAVVLSGIEAPFGVGDYIRRPPVPLLLAHGGADTTIHVDGSEGLYAAATGPVAFLRFPDGTHTSILASAAGELLDDTIVAWLDRWLRDDPTALDRLPAEVAASGIATLTTR